MPRGLSVPTLVKRASIGGLEIAMEWSCIARNFICVEIKVSKSLGPAVSGRTGVVRKADEYSIASFRAAFISLKCWTRVFSC
jgi:hypothetical protein